MVSGKLDEELRRMSGIADQIKPGAILLASESFASTNEREGSDIGDEVLGALNSGGVKVLLVTHLYDLAERLRRDQRHGRGLRVWRHAADWSWSEPAPSSPPGGRHDGWWP
jgi:hypothetical protein